MCYRYTIELTSKRYKARTGIIIVGADEEPLGARII